MADGDTSSSTTAAPPDGSTSNAGTGGSTTTGDPPPLDTSSGGSTDAESSTGEPACELDGSCDVIDIVFVIDNSGTMGEEQQNLARNVPALVEELQVLLEVGGAIDPDINVMFTTTDMGHPLCTAFEHPSYEPRAGAPVYSGCNSRIQDFTGLDPQDPLVMQEACTDLCPVDVAPSDPFIHWTESGTNVPGDDVAAALACLGPQGINGCGYESPLETMLQATNPQACWNDPSQPVCDGIAEWADLEQGFLRPGGVLAIVIITDELDCSVQPPEGYAYFTDPSNTTYWNVNPDVMIPQATSAICFNAGASCIDADGDQIYESCDAADDGVLQPVERYTSHLEYLAEQQDKTVVMLGLFGVPSVVERSPDPPYQPTAGGVFDLVYRNWIDLPYPGGDILPDEWDSTDPQDDPQVRAADKIFEFGAIAPGCTGIGEGGTVTGQALPPIRLRHVCESLDTVDPATGEPVSRCCMESLCDGDFGPAFRCLAGHITTAVEPG